MVWGRLNFRTWIGRLLLASAAGMGALLNLPVARAGSPTGDGAPICRDTDPAGFKAAVRAFPAAPVVFFASWCPECPRHLNKAVQPDSVVVAAFDEREAAGKALLSLNLKWRACFYDHDGALTKLAGVDSVPAVRTAAQLGLAGP